MSMINVDSDFYTDLLVDRQRLTERNQELVEALKIIDTLGADTLSHVRSGEMHIPGCCPYCIARAALAKDKDKEEEHDKN